MSVPDATIREMSRDIMILFFIGTRGTTGAVLWSFGPGDLHGVDGG
jgi:hypothetical protein